MNSRFLSCLSKLLISCDKDVTDQILLSISEKKIESKLWLHKEISLISNPQKIVLLGSWYPLLFFYFFSSAKEIVCVDIDGSVIGPSKKFSTSFIPDVKVNFICSDAKSFVQGNSINGYDLIVNTSCEHMSYDMKDITIDRNPIYAFQSNDYFQIKEHINCKNTLEDFVASTNLSNIKYSGTKSFNKFNRFMVIGKTDVI